MKWFGKKEETEKVSIGVGFKDLHVNPNPAKKAIRNAARAMRIQQLLDSKPADWPCRASFEKELKRRILQAQIDELKGGK